MSSNSASICHTFGHLLVEYLFGKQTRAYTRFKHTLSITHTEVSYHKHLPCGLARSLERSQLFYLCLRGNEWADGKRRRHWI